MLLSSLISASVILFVLQFDKYRKQRSARALSNYELNCEVLQTVLKFSVEIGM